MSSVTHLKDRAIALRLEGKSYGQILKNLGVKSKGTLSAWFKNLELTPKALEKLKQNIQLAHDRGLTAFNEKRTAEIKEENKTAFDDGWKQIRNLSARDLTILGAALYWGEGTKSEHASNGQRLVFTNSDPEMVRVYISFVRKILVIDESKIRAGIHIHLGIDPDKAKKYWSKVTGLPPSRFYIVYQVSRASQGKRPFNKLPYGTVVIKVSNRKIFFRIKGMIRGLIDGQ